MLNDADGHGGGEADEAREKLTDADAIFLRLKKQVKADYNSKGQVNWRRRRAKTSTEQLSDDDKAILQDARAPDRHFQPCRNDGRQRSWSGSRQPQEVQFLPRRLGVEEKRASDVGGGFASNATRKRKKAPRRCDRSDHAFIACQD
jgi:hypothetical protein